MLPEEYFEPQQYSGVMVSGTFRDLEEVRKILIQAISGQDLFPVAMENAGAKSDVDLIDSSLQMVRKATAYIALIGRRYGQIPVCPTRNPAKLSITELEFNEALRLNRRILLFMMGPDYLLRPIDMDTDPYLIEKLDAFAERAKRFRPDSPVHRVYATFNNLQEFTAEANQAVADLGHAIDGPPGRLAQGAPSDSVHDQLEPRQIPRPPAFYAEPKYIPGNAFVGRQDELATLREWAAASDQYPVLLFDAIGGNGKSMLTWHWVTHQSVDVRADWAGRFWYSFYERGAIMADFCRRALAYMTGRPLDQFRDRKMSDLADLLLFQLNARPWLLILDGLERVLVEYHRIDAASLPDEQVSNPTDQIAQRDPCSTIRPEDDDLLRAMVGAAPSKLLITSRLVPRALLSPATHQPIPGVRRLPLLGLRPADAEALFRSCAIRGESKAIQHYLKSHCDCHPLVTGVLAGIVGDYLPDRGNFDAWADDPAGGGQLDLAKLDLVQKRNHILKAGFDALPQPSRRLLSVLALLSEAVDYATLKALNPRLPPEPEEVDKPEDPENLPWLESMPSAERDWYRQEYNEGLRRWNQYQQALEAHRRSPAVANAEKDLGDDVRDLDRRGFLQYDAQSKRYDLHPVVRGIAVGRLTQTDRESLGQRVVDYFSQQTHIPYQEAQTLEELRSGLHVVRAFLQMGRLKEAADAYLGKLCNPLLTNLEAYAEVLSLERPWFPSGWGVLPEGMPDAEAIHLTKDAASALVNTFQWEQALAADGAIITHCLQSDNWREVSIALIGVANALDGMNRTAKLQRVVLLALEIASLALGKEELFLRRLDTFTALTRFAGFTEAEELWKLLDPMGRDWSLAAYRPGIAEARYVAFQLRQGTLTNHDLTAAEQLATKGKHLPTIRSLHELRGEWYLGKGEWELAAESLTEAVRMFRQAGLASPVTDAMLALAKFHLGSCDDARSEAERLSKVSDPPHLELANLWFALGDHQRATTSALEAYKSAWADGEPYSYRFSVERARSLLLELGAAIPDLPAYDATKDPKYSWEEPLEAAMAKLRISEAPRSEQAAE